MPPPTGGPYTWGLASETVRRAIAHRLIRACGSAVAVANDSNLDDVLCVVDSVDDPVIADANSPQVIAALKFFAASRLWLLGKCIDLCDDSIDDFLRQRFEFFRSGPHDPHVRHRDGLFSGDRPSRGGPGQSTSFRSAHALAILLWQRREYLPTGRVPAGDR